MGKYLVLIWGKMNSKIHRMEHFINSWLITRRHHRLSRMADFLSAFERQFDHLRQSRPQNFNLFSLLKMETDEVKHTQFLAWLLDSKATHDHGNLFLQEFCSCCQLNLLPTDLHQYQVYSEYVGKESTVDILIYRQARFIIYLENKVYAPEGVNQVDREYRDMCRLADILHIPEMHRFMIFLTSTGYSPISGNAILWKTLSYGDLAAVFRASLPKITSEKMKWVLTDWLDTVASFGG
jgi:hypothetical protein